MSGATGMSPDERSLLVEQLRAAMKSRALVYAAMYDEIAAEFGPERARELCRRAIYRRGESVGEQFARFAPDDLDGLRQAFLDFIPQGPELFAPEVVRCDRDALEIKFHRCPLKEAWQEAGYDDARIAALCEIAGVVDYGTFERAGFALDSKTWRPGDTGCCRLLIRPGTARAGAPGTGTASNEDSRGNP